MKSKIKASLVGAYLDYIMLTENPSDNEIGEIFDKLYEKSEKELKMYDKIYTKKLEEINEQKR